MIALCWFIKRNLSRLGGVIAMRVCLISLELARENGAWLLRLTKAGDGEPFWAFCLTKLPGYTQGNLLLHHLFPISCNVVMGSLFGRVFGNYTKEQYSKHGGILSSQGH